MRYLFVALGAFALAVSLRAQITVYDDALQNGWTDNSFGGGTSFSSTAYAHSGTKSMSIAGNNFNAIGITNASAVTTATYPAIHFWVNGGLGSGQHINLYVGATNQPIDAYITGGSIAAGTWREVTVNITQAPFSYASATYNQIYLQSEANGEQTVYFDDLTLQAAGPPPAASQMQYSENITTLPANSPMLSDQITWQDSAGHLRSAVLAHDNVGVLNNNVGAQVYGHALRQFTYQLTDGSTRTADVTKYGNGGYGGFGYVVDHSNAGNCFGGDDSPLGSYIPMGSFTRVFKGRHHSIYRYTQLYNRPCGDNTMRTIPVT